MDWVSIIRLFQLTRRPAVAMKAELVAFEAAGGADLDMPVPGGPSQRPRRRPGQRQYALCTLAMPLASCSDLPALASNSSESARPRSEGGSNPGKSSDKPASKVNAAGGGGWSRSRHESVLAGYEGWRQGEAGVDKPETKGHEAADG